MRGQLSAEMLILIVVIMAIMAIAATQLMGTAKETGDSIQNQAEHLNRMTSEGIKSKEGGLCVFDEDCMDGGPCDSNRCA